MKIGFCMLLWTTSVGKKHEALLRDIKATGYDGVEIPVFDGVRDLVRALTRRGRYVAMIGDGVNDVLALKEARLAIAMGSGSQIAKGVSDIVLLKGGFASVPAAIEEGRKIIRNTHRVAKLFVTKSVYAATLLATVGLAPIAFPFLPRHLTVTASLTIGIPAFFLALAPSSGPVARERFVRDLLAFTVPAGLITAAALIGGIDSPGGAVVGGFLVGVLENVLGAYVVGNELKLAVALALIVGVLVIKPSGLFGSVQVTRV